MKMLGILVACLLTGVAQAQSTAQVQVMEPPAPKPHSSVSVWVQPLGALAFGLAWAVGGNTYVMVPLGMNLPLSPTQELVIEATPIFIHQDCEGPCTTRALALAVGSAWTLSSEPSRGGFFLQPKLMGIVSREVGVSDSGLWTQTDGQLSLGLDVGYRLRSGPLFLSFVLGGSVGRGWNVPISSRSVFFSLLDWPQRSREDTWVLDLNLNLVRIGASF